MAERICPNCLTTFTMQLRVSAWIMLVIGLLFMALFATSCVVGDGLVGVIIGLLPSLICLNSVSRSFRSCPECGSRNSVPSETPRGKELFRESHKKDTSDITRRSDHDGPSVPSNPSEIKSDKRAEKVRPVSQGGKISKFVTWDKPATDTQIEYLKKRGFSEDELREISYVQAGKIIAHGSY